MATTIKTTHRPLVILALPKTVPALITYSENIAKRVTANPYFPNPTPTIAALIAATDALRDAEAATISRLKGAVPERNDKRKSLVSLLEQLRAYIQTVADADEGNAPAIIESAGLAVRRRATRPPRVFAAKPGRTSGTANIVAASAGHRAGYEWQYSIDAGKTWIYMPATLRAKTTIAGLTPGSTVQFKYRAVTRAGETDWSAPVSLTVP